jgi:hypothetical protein
MFDLIPNQTNDENGVSRDSKSVLSTKISIPYQKRSIPEHIEEIFAALAKISGVRVQLGSALFRPSTQIEFGVQNISAREAIGQLLESATKTPVSYRLLYDFKNRQYMMNLQAVTDVKNSAGKSESGPPDQEAMRLEALKRWGNQSKP